MSVNRLVWVRGQEGLNSKSTLDLIRIIWEQTWRWFSLLLVWRGLNDWKGRGWGGRREKREREDRIEETLRLHQQVHLTFLLFSSSRISFFPSFFSFFFLSSPSFFSFFPLFPFHTCDSALPPPHPTCKNSSSSLHSLLFLELNKLTSLKRKKGRERKENLESK